MASACRRPSLVDLIDALVIRSAEIRVQLRRWAEPERGWRERAELGHREPACRAELGDCRPAVKGLQA